MRLLHWCKLSLALLLAGSGLRVGAAEVNALYAAEQIQLNGSSICELASPEKAAELVGPGEFSITFLCRPERGGKYQVVLAQATAGPADRSFWIGYQPSSNRFDFLVRAADGKTQTQVFGNPNVDPDGWNLVAASAGDGELRLVTVPLSADMFPEQISKRALGKPVGLATVGLTLGGRTGEPAISRFKGRIENIVFWSTALNRKELGAIFMYLRSGKRIDRNFSLAGTVKQYSSRISAPTSSFPAEKTTEGIGAAEINALYATEQIQLNGSSICELASPEKAAELVGPGEFSITFLCRPERGGKYQVVLAQATAGPADRSFWIGYQPSSNRFDFLVRAADGKTQTQVFGNPNVDPDGWNLVAASAGDGELRLVTVPLSADMFPEQISKRALGKPVGLATVGLTLGGRTGEPAISRFKGRIENIVFWSTALNRKELGAIFMYLRSGKRIDRNFSLAGTVKQYSSRISAPPSSFSPAGKLETFQSKPMVLNAGEEYVLPDQIVSGDFLAEIEFVVPKWNPCRFQLDLGADGFLFDGADMVLRGRGHEGIDTFRAQPVNVNFKDLFSDGTPCRFSVKKKGGLLTLRLNGREVYRTAFPRDTVGEVAVCVEKGLLDLRSFSLNGRLMRGNFIPVFSPGQEGTAVYRIPALARAKDGTLLAFAEARHDSVHDLGDIDIVLRRSVDGGGSWLPIQSVIRGRRGTKLSSVNPSVVVDPESGRIHLFCYQSFQNKWASGEYKLLHSFSDDNGVTWSEPKDHKPELSNRWLSFQPGPGHAIILRRGKFKGRIVVPGWYVHTRNQRRVFASAVIYSDDNGRSFHSGGTGMDGSDECMVAELADGAILMGIRPPQGEKDSEFRHFAVSRDGGASFAPFMVDRELRAPICQASLLSSDDGNRVYFCYPAGGSYEPDASTRRAALTLRSRTADSAWSEPLLIYAGRSGYSDLVLLDENRIGILFEGGRRSSYKDGIWFAAVKQQEAGCDGF